MKSNSEAAKKHAARRNEDAANKLAADTRKRAENKRRGPRTQPKPLLEL